MSIAYLVSQYPAINHTFILREIRQLRAAGFDIRVISIAAPDRPSEQMNTDEQEEAAQTYHVKPRGISGALGAHLSTLIARPLGYLRGLVYALRLGRLDVRKTLSHVLYFVEAVMVGHQLRQQRLSHLHVHFSSTVGLIVRRIFPVTLSITIHGPDEFNDPGGFHLTEKIRESLFISAISSYARSQLLKAAEYEDWDKIEVAPLGIDPGVFVPRPFRESPETFEIICVGRLAPVKAQHVLIAAVGRLVREGRQVRLRLVGDGPDRAALERHVESRRLAGSVVFEGWLNQDRVRELYRQTDIFALASFAEGVPVVLMEAMAMEIPCVATRITGVPELIRDGVDGCLVTPAYEDELAQAIAKLMDDPALRRRLGAAGRRRVLEKYDLPRNVNLLAGIFQRRLAGAAPERSMVNVSAANAQHPVMAAGDGSRNSHRPIDQPLPVTQEKIEFR
ncbi:MAG: glycosyltransferase family 4 protein [Acidobacteriota bacterium]|nr:glycosyltransferase family 4 protein [Acidobacteriota bacterium]